MKCEPAAQRVIEAVHLVGAEQEIISRLAVQLPVAGMPVRPGIGEVNRVDQRRIGVGAKQQWSLLGRQPGSEGDCLPRLDDSPGHAWRSVIARRDKRRSLHLCLDEQESLGKTNPIEQPRTTETQPVAGDSDTAPPHRRVVLLPAVPQIDGPDYPIGTSSTS